MSTSTQTLHALYGDDERTLALQTSRYTQAQQCFLEAFGAPAETAFRTPGRINLLGEHTDYNGGFVLPVALDRDVVCLTRRRSDAVIRAVNVEPGFAPFSFELGINIPSAPRGDWSNFFRGAAQELCRRFGTGEPLTGMDVCVSGAMPLGVPRGAGLSSSTALTVTVALALVTLNEINVDRPDLAHLCSEAEWYVGTRGGMMDQFSTLLAKRDHALFLDCRPDPDGVYSYSHVSIPPSVQIVLLNSGVRHENTRSAFNQSVAECKVGVRLLQRRHPNVAALRDATPSAMNLSESDFWAVLRDILPERATLADLVARGLKKDWLEHLVADHSLDTVSPFAVLARCRHVITENKRVLAGITALEAVQIETFGALMNQAHASMSEDYGASCPEVDQLAEITRQQPGVFGARITGAGWGGGVVALFGHSAAAGQADAIAAAYKQRTGLDSEVFVCRPAGGASQVEL